MKATGIVRRIDDLGRIVIPKEIRRTLRLRDGDPLEIFTDRQGEVILKKYSPIEDLSELAEEYAESAGQVLGSSAVVTDTDHVIAVFGGTAKHLKDRPISGALGELIRGRKSCVVSDRSKVCEIAREDHHVSEYGSQIIVPILAEGDPVGSVILVNQEKDGAFSEKELKAAEVGAALLGRQLEI